MPTEFFLSRFYEVKDLSDLVKSMFDCTPQAISSFVASAQSPCRILVRFETPTVIAAMYNISLSKIRTGSVSTSSKQAQGPISSSSDNPRLLRVESTVKDTHALLHRVAPENLDGNYQRVLHEITVHHAMADDDGAIV